MSFFQNIPLLPVDPIFGVSHAFTADPRPNKINLSVGAYKTAEGQPLVLSSVKKAENILLQRALNKEYLPIEGDPQFLESAAQLMLGADSPVLQSGRYFSAQSVGGTSALRISAELLAKCSSKMIFIPQPSWENHKQTFEHAGLKVGTYPYLDPLTHYLDYSGMCEAIQNMPKKSIILLHACCHNPTGVDLNEEQWKELSDLIQKQELIPFFDMAYHGFGKGLEEDAKAVRYFANKIPEMVIAYSFSKNFSLYGERVGFLMVISPPTFLLSLKSQIKSLIRGNYSNPPLHGARIVSTILQSPELGLEWKKELEGMRERIEEMRRTFIAALLAQTTDRDLSYLKEQQGLFSFLGLGAPQVQYLRDEKAIYMPYTSRINVASLNTQNVSYVAESIASSMQCEK